jgi:hypothetical protein
LVLVAFATAAFAVAAIAVGNPPRAADSGEAVVAWFRAHGDAARWSVWALTVGQPAFVVMSALLRRLLPEPHRDVFFAGAIVLVAMTGVQSWTTAGLALHADTLDPATARTVLDVAIFFGPVLTASTFTMMAPVTLLALQGRAGLPRWLAWLGVVAIVEQSIETITIFGTTGFTEPGGAMNLQLGAGLVGLWIVAFAVWGGIRGRVPLASSPAAE